MSKHNIASFDYIRLLDKQNRSRFLDLISLHIDNLQDLKKKNLSDDKVDILINNIKKSGPVIIKLFQWFSNNSSKFLEYDNKYSKIIIKKKMALLQDNCEKRDVERIIKRIKKKVKDFNIDNFNMEPIGIGSIAQVHKYNNKIIKVLHKNIKNEMNTDILLIKNIIEIIKKDNENNLSDTLKLLNVINFDKISNELLKQINLVNEYKNLNLFKDININFLKFPKIYLVSTNILIEEFIEGNKITFFENDELKYIECKIKIFIVFLSMINIGVIHGDMHDGNILIDKNNNINLIDFGIIRKISKNDTINIKKLINIIKDNINKNIDEDDTDYLYNLIKDIINILCVYKTNKLNIIINNFIELVDEKNTINILTDLINYLYSYSIKNEIIINDNVIYCILMIVSLLSDHNIKQKYMLNLIFDYIDKNDYSYLIDLNKSDELNL